MSIVDLVVHKTHVLFSLFVTMNGRAQNFSWFQFCCTPLSEYLCLLCLFFLLPLQEKIESATDILKAVLKPVVDEEKEIVWPPTDPEALKLMEKVSYCDLNEISYVLFD